MTADEFLSSITACRNWILAQASKHEQSANFAMYMNNKIKEEADRVEQNTLLKFAKALSMVIEEHNS